MKIKLLGTRSDLSGFIGTIEFKNGISVADVSQRDADAVKANFRCEIIDGMTTNDRIRLMSQPGYRTPPVAKEAIEVPQKVDESEQTIDSGLYTEAQLGEIADKEGIAGLRAIADSLGVRDKSIVGLIKGIMQKQGK